MIEQPAATYVALVLATVALLVEIALPTYGISGLIALVLAAIGGAGVVRQQLAWWPLLLAACGIVLWVVGLARRRDNVVFQAAAATLFAAGSVVFALLAVDAPAVIAAIVGSVAVPVIYPGLLRATQRLMDRPPAVGMEAMVGRTGDVEEWSDTSGSVRVDGSFWHADGPAGLEPGSRVVVRYVDGMRLVVGPAAREREELT